MKLVFRTTFANILERTLLKNSKQLLFCKEKKVYDSDSSLIKVKVTVSNKMNITNMKGNEKITWVLITSTEI
jgi:hypothetical protein